MPDQPSRAARSIFALERKADRPWFLPFTALFPMADYALPFLPNQMLLTGLALSLPRRWLALALTFALATGIGAGLVAAAIQYWGSGLVQMLSGSASDPGQAAKVLAALESYGLWALAGFAMLPWPPRLAVLVCALAGLSPAGMTLAVASGRLLPALSYAGLGALAPHVLRRNRRIDAVMREVEALRPHPPG
ncbi:MAG: hypothetical protein ACK442_00180 [Novosphingobium sp.]|jgi:hypothetical protein|nr:hypothetical protein [Brevundimonas sp.]MCZ8323365.1 hypothetical protein [Novosphingobium sp.]